MSRYSELDVVFVAGPPGAGKSSITEEYQSAHASTDQFGTGDLVWDIVAGRTDSEYAHILQEAAEKEIPIPDDIFSMVVRERIKRASGISDTVIVTGFPYNYSDWEIFNQTIRDDNIHLLTSVVLTADMHTCVTRMRERDVNKGVDAAVVHSAQERIAYEKRYYDLIGRLTIRLNCYKQAGLSVTPISAERPRDEVAVEFDDTITMFKQRKAQDD